MFNIVVCELEKNKDEVDNETRWISQEPVLDKARLLVKVEELLPTLGGDHDRWLEISILEED